MAETYYRIDGGAWRTGTSFTLRTSIRHKLRGLPPGDYVVEYRSTDNAGNIEKRDIRVKVDLTPPDISFAMWRQLLTYYPCETLQLQWKLIDADSGPKLSTATLEGRPVVLNERVDVSRLAVNEIYTLQVLGYDKAGNRTIKELKFSVIDHGTIAVGQPLVKRTSAKTRYLFTGTLTPKHWKGTTPLKLVISKRRANGDWVIKQKIGSFIQEDGTYKAFATLTAGGKYRVRAEHYEPTAFSPYRYFRISY